MGLVAYSVCSEYKDHLELQKNAESMKTRIYLGQYVKLILPYNYTIFYADMILCIERNLNKFLPEVLVIITL